MVVDWDTRGRVKKFLESMSWTVTQSPVGISLCCSWHYNTRNKIQVVEELLSHRRTLVVSVTCIFILLNWKMAFSEQPYRQTILCFASKISFWGFSEDEASYWRWGNMNATSIFVKVALVLKTIVVEGTLPLPPLMRISIVVSQLSMQTDNWRNHVLSIYRMEVSRAFFMIL